MLQVRRLAGASVSAEAGPQWRTVTLEFDGPDEPFTERLQILAGQVREPLAIDHLVLTEDGRVIFDDSFETAPGR